MKRGHEWGFIGIDKETNVTYAYCILCNRYCISGSTHVYIPRGFLIERIRKGMVTGGDGKLLNEGDIL